MGGRKDVYFLFYTFECLTCMYTIFHFKREKKCKKKILNHMNVIRKVILLGENFLMYNF